MLITDTPVIVKGTISEIFNVIGKAAGMKAEDLRWWNIEKAGNSEIVNKTFFDLTITGKESKKPLKPKKEILFVGKLWIYSSQEDSEGKEEWVLKTFQTVSIGKKYYEEIKDREGLTRLLVFFNGGLIEVDGLEFDLFEIRYMEGVSQYLRTIEEIEAELIRFNNLEDRVIKDASTVKLYRKGIAIPYIYNNEDNVIEWL